MRSWSSPVFYKKAHDYLLSIITIHVDMKIIWKNFEIAKEQQGIFAFKNNTGDLTGEKIKGICK